MTKEEYENLEAYRPIDNIIEGSDLKNQTDRVLVYGYTKDRMTFIVSLKNGEITVEIGAIGNGKRIFNIIGVLSNEDYVPDKRVYPAKSDYEFCKLLKEAGVYIPFTTFIE